MNDKKSTVHRKENLVNQKLTNITDMSDTNNGNGEPVNPEDVVLDSFDPTTDKEVEEAGDDVEKLKEILKIRTESRQKLYARTKEAEKKAKEAGEKKPDSSKSTGTDYAQEAYLIARGVTEDTDIEFVIKESKETGKSIKEVLSMRYVTEELKANKEQRDAEGAMPKDSTSRGGQGNRTSVDYWIQKGELPPEDQSDLRRKVVNEKLKRSQQKTKFATGTVTIK